MKQYYTYILRCADDTLYTGYTDDIPRRIATHNAGLGAKYTRARRPVALAYAAAYPTRSQAQSREEHIKQLTRNDKLALIAQWDGHY